MVEEEDKGLEPIMDEVRELREEFGQEDDSQEDDCSVLVEESEFFL